MMAQIFGLLQSFILAFEDASDGLANSVIFSEWVKGTADRTKDGLGMVYGAGLTGESGLPNDAFFNLNMSKKCQAATTRMLRGWAAAGRSAHASRTAASISRFPRCRRLLTAEIASSFASTRYRGSWW